MEIQVKEQGQEQEDESLKIQKADGVGYGREATGVEFNTIK